jgi:HSP20 family molecular chaperone IbpA
MNTHLATYRPKANGLSRSHIVKDINDLFGDMLGGGFYDPFIWSSTRTTTEKPADYEMWVENGTLTLRVDAPGVKSEDVSVTLDKGVIHLVCERKEVTQPNKQFSSVKYGKREYAVTLPTEVDQETIKAKLTDGILEITASVPKELTPRKIMVE